jgi:hypothetical protein
MEPEEISQPPSEQPSARSNSQEQVNEVATPSTDYVAVTEGGGKKKIIIAVVGIIILVILFWFMFFRGSNNTDQVANQTAVEQPITTQPYELERTAPVSMPADDQDGDGIKDEEEERLGTSLLEFDTDFDGLSDIAEIEVWKTDPTNWDTDGDGFADGFEVINGFNPAGPGTIDDAVVQEDSKDQDQELPVKE